jgi:RecG-like helicase
MITLFDRMSVDQAHKLESVGIRTIYDLIVYFPYKLDKIIPLEDFKQHPYHVLFLAHAQLVTVRRKPGKQPILILELETKIGLITAYVFSVATFTLASLTIGTEYQFIMSQKNGFWSVEKFAQLSKKESIYFHLGRSPVRSYIIPRYSKIGPLQSSFFETVHRQLKPSDYILNINGLVPDQSIIPQLIDMSRIHHPSSHDEYDITYRDFLALKVFLRLTLMRYNEYISKKEYARPTELDKEYLQQVTKKLPYSLSQSQKIAIWDILQSLI